MVPLTCDVFRRKIECCFILCFIILRNVLSFPSGAPVEACDSTLPRHVHTAPKSPDESPYIFTASAGRFYPDSKRRKIKVRIRGPEPFKGFFVVALDADTHERIGSFVNARGMQALPCAAVTHLDGMPKVAANMLWQPPADKKKGEVIFMATVLQSFSNYYSGLMATIPAKKQNKQPLRKSSPSSKSAMYSLDSALERAAMKNISSTDNV